MVIVVQPCPLRLGVSLVDCRVPDSGIPLDKYGKTLLGSTHALEQLEDHVTVTIVSFTLRSGCDGGARTWEGAKRGVRRHRDQSFWLVRMNKEAKSRIF